MNKKADDIIVFNENKKADDSVVVCSMKKKEADDSVVVCSMKKASGVVQSCCVFNEKTQTALSGNLSC